MQDVSSKTYIVMICYGEKCSRKRVKVDNTADARLVGIIGVAVKVGERLRNTLVLGEIGFEDFKSLAEKYGVDVNEVKGYLVEVREEKKSIQEVWFSRS